MCCDQTVYKLKINKLRWIFTVWYTLFPSDSFFFAFFTFFALFAFFKLQRYSYQRSCHTQEPNYQKLNRKCMDRNWTLAFCDFFLSLCNEVNNKFGKTQWMFKWRLKAGWVKEKTETGKKDCKEKSYFLFRQFIMHKHFTLWSNISSSLMYVVCQWCTIF